MCHEIKTGFQLKRLLLETMDKNIYLLIVILLSSLQPVISNSYDACGETSFSPGLILGGNRTERGEFPFLCLLYNIEENLIFCGGTLISTKHVLTGKPLISGENSELLKSFASIT